MTEKTQPNPLLKLALDIGPLLLFFFANSRPALFEPLIRPIIPAAVATGERAGIFVATAVFMVAILVALAVSYAMTRRLPMMALVSAVVVVVFGGLTLFLQDELFIKLKPTIIYRIVRGRAVRRHPVPQAAARHGVRSDVQSDRGGLAQADGALGLFFLVLAVLNEIVWRTQSTDTWVTFKVFGVMPLTFVFAMLQMPLLKKYDNSPKN